MKPSLQTTEINFETQRYALSQGVLVWDAHQKAHSVSPRVHVRVSRPLGIPSQAVI